MALHQERCNTDIRKYSFTHRVVSVWNTLPNKVVQSKTVDEFKRRIDHAWRNEKVKFDYKEELGALRATHRK